MEKENMNENIDDLKRLAEAATKGPWESDSCGDVWTTQIIVNDGKAFEAIGPHFKTIGTTSTGPDNGDAAYIAAANPTAILSLIESYEQLQRKFEESLEVIRIIDLNFKKITKCPDNTCDGCHEDAKIAAEYSSKFLRSLDKGK